ncbi:MAG: hypothetical protein ACO32T_05050 [Candidatus Nanopelagicaceae bacterium]
MVQANWINLKIPKKLKSIHSWNVPYAAAVHEGTTTVNGKEKPARPWVDVAIKEYDFLDKYADSFSQSSNFKQAFLEMSEGFGETCQSNISDTRWQWPRTTVRKSGAVVDSPRDIVDTGELRNSYEVKYESS